MGVWRGEHRLSGGESYKVQKYKMCKDFCTILVHRWCIKTVVTGFVLYAKYSEVHKGTMWLCSKRGITVDLRMNRLGDGT